MLEKIGVVLVTYNTNINNCEAIVSLKNSIRTDEKLKIVIYDNGIKKHEEFDSLDKQFDYTYIHNPENPGLSFAANKGAEILREKKVEWIIFLNPDTLLSNNFLLEIVANIEVHNYKIYAPILISNSFIVSPCKYYLYKASVSKEYKTGRNSLKNKTILFSGMCIEVNTFFSLGGFNPRIRLDFMDFYFIDKFKAIYNEFYLINSICKHDLSSFEKNFNKVLIRFKYYCNGAKIYADSFPKSIFIFVGVLLRTLKLSIIFKSLSFWKLLIKEFVFFK